MKRAELYTIYLIVLIILWNLIRVLLVNVLESYNNIDKYDEGNVKILRMLFEKLITLLNPSYKLPLLSTIAKIEIEKYLSIIIVFPFYILILLGCYCLCKLGLDLVYFRNCPEESIKLSEDIIRAREDLKKRGYKDD